ncbi:MAG: hypothetical protein QOD90_1621 [Mycobacterium sp.]|jgi:hypothetical protein|nr:hypothetical protein [Mycobacterium sp.]
MTYDFPSEVERIVGPSLATRGYALDEVDPRVDEGGRWGSVVYYRGADTKVQVYLSTREGEVNCMIAPLDAPNEYGLRNRSKKWRYFTRFIEHPNVPLEELVKLIPVAPSTDEGRLEFVKDTIEECFTAAHAGILQI